MRGGVQDDDDTVVRTTVALTQKQILSSAISTQW